MLRVTEARADLVLLGFGFAPYHTDSSYMFLFNRGGLVALGVFLVWLVAILSRDFGRWGWPERALVITCLLCGLTLDSFIYRHVVFFMIAAGVPWLASGRRAARV